MLPSFNSFFFNDTATTEIYTLSLHDALPIYAALQLFAHAHSRHERQTYSLLHESFDGLDCCQLESDVQRRVLSRSEEHTSELQSRQYLVCRLLLEKKKKLYIILPTAQPLYMC